MSNYYQQSTVEVMDLLNVTNEGLADEDVQIRQEEYETNELEEGKRTSTIAVFLSQFKDLLVIILMVAAAISFLLGNLKVRLLL